MKKVRTDDPKYPLKITLTTGETMLIPRQSKFDNEWLKKHGCSIMAEYIAMQWLGVKKVGSAKLWPITLLRWHKKNTPDLIGAKVLIKAIPAAIKALSKGKAKYYKGVTKARMEDALAKSHLVIFEQKNPIHTVILIPDDGAVYVATYGTVTKTTVSKMMGTVLKKSKSFPC